MEKYWKPAMKTIGIDCEQILLSGSGDEPREQSGFGGDGTGYYSD